MVERNIEIIANNVQERKEAEKQARKMGFSFHAMEGDKLIYHKGIDTLTVTCQFWICDYR